MFQITQIILRYYYTYKFYNCLENINGICCSNRQSVIDKHTWWTTHLFTIHNMMFHDIDLVKRPSKYIPTQKTYVPEKYFTFKVQNMNLQRLINKKYEFYEPYFGPS